jgi:sigma-54 dependent transcriptional regulator, acetoin dehydrogenase operon transcriptional activator AcoR
LHCRASLPQNSAGEDDKKDKTMETLEARRHLETVNTLLKGGAPDEGIEGDRAAWLKQAWQRSVEQHKLDPGRPSRRHVFSAAELRQAWERVDEFRSIARPHLDELYRQVRVASYSVVMTDADGVTLDLKSEGEFGATLKDAGVRVGTVLTEELEGTCGIGTAIADRKPVLIHRGEHFRVHNIGLSCSAAPIFDLDERLVAVLDASAMYSPHKLDAQAMVFEIVNDKALTIENAYVSHLLRRHWRISLGRRPDHRAAQQDWMLAFDSAGVIVGANRPAREALLARFRGQRSLRVSDLFDTTAEDLIAAAHAQPNLALPFRLLATHELVFGVLKSPERAADRVDAGVPRAHEADALARAVVGDTKMLANATLARKLADRQVPLMLRGETGTGKEVFARAVHEVSARRHKPFVAMNCAAIPETLIESELFGYREGAFTGARAQGAQGKLLQSSGGTLFLDEIGDMPLSLQSRLLRVLAEREVVPLGAEAALPIELNVICASHRDLLTMVEQGGFREDLYYRLNGACIELPPLREREDIGRLISNILAEEADSLGRAGVRLQPEALEALKALPWPGNVRQLRHALRYACAVSDLDRLTVDCFPPDLFRARPAVVEQVAAPRETPAHPPIRARMLEALEASEWNIEAAAKRIGMPRSTFYRKMGTLAIKSGA